MKYRDALNLTTDYKNAILRTSAFREIAELVLCKRNEDLLEEASNEQHRLWRRLMTELGALDDGRIPKDT